jgi:RHS repeat-associated protein
VAVYDENGVNITNFRPEYWHTDHLGNVRLAFSDVNNNGRIEIEDDPGTLEDDTEIMQENHYYPFGMNQMGPWYETVTPENKYQYNGKELNEELGLDWYDYGARWYDGSIGRWNAVDPMAEDYLPYSPYNYALNNPLIFIDPDGQDNTIYLVTLKGIEKHVNVNQVVENANQYFNNLGVKTQVVLFNGNVEDLNKIDETDGIAILGSSKEQITDFVQNNLMEVTSESFREGRLENWKNTKNNPEISENNSGNGGNVIVINASDLGETANNFLSTKAEAGAFLLVHGSGHLAGLGHDRGYTSLMSSGSAITAMIQGSNGNPLYNTRNECYTCIQDFTNTRNNDVYKKQFIKRFGNDKPNPKLVKK